MYQENNKLLLQLKKDKDYLEKEIAHPKRTIVKNKIIKNLKITSKIIRLLTPYILVAGGIVGGWKMLGMENKKDGIEVSQSVDEKVASSLLLAATISLAEVIPCKILLNKSSSAFSNDIKKIKQEEEENSLENLKIKARIKEENYARLNADKDNSKPSPLFFPTAKSIFEYINKNDNDSFSEMNSYDLQELLEHIQHYGLELRPKLDLDEDITFGLELETECAKEDMIRDEMKKNPLFHDWIVAYDDSLESGVEIKTPILYNFTQTWINVENICSILQKYSVIKNKAGGHIHAGSHILGRQGNTWRNYLKLLAGYENISYRYYYNDWTNARNEINDYARPIARDILQNEHLLDRRAITTPKELIKNLRDEKHQGVNFKRVFFTDNLEKDNTIELRCPNGTLNPIIWQNNVNVFLHSLCYAKNEEFNHDIVDKRIIHNKDYYNQLYLYNEIFLPQALEYCDLIFSKNIDKVYFLRQYLKSGTIYSDYRQEKPFTKQKEDKKKSFTKKRFFRIHYDI